jgi:hypothetical protein
MIKHPKLNSRHNQDENLHACLSSEHENLCLDENEEDIQSSSEKYEELKEAMAILIACFFLS